MRNDSLRSILLEVQELEGREQYEAIVNKLNDSLLKKYQNAELYYRRGYSFYKLDKTTKALQDLEEASEIEPNGLIYNTLGNIWHAEKKFSKAIAYYSEAIECKPDFAVAFFNRGNSYFHLNQLKTAVENYTQALEFDPNSIQYRDLRGSTYFLIHEYDKAIDDLSIVIAHKRNFSAYFSRGSAYLAKKKFTKAIKDFSEAIKIKPNHSETLLLLGTARIQVNQYLRAEKDILKSIKIAPSSSAFVHLGLIHVHQDNFKKAIKDFTNAINLDSNDATVFHYRGLCYLIMRSYKKSLLDHIETSKRDLSFPFSSFYNVVKSLNIKDRDEILMECLGILYGPIDQIRSLSSVKPDGIKFVAHYTKLKVADALIKVLLKKKEHNKLSSQDARLRYYNAIYMNDPSEGKILLDYINDKEIESAFKNGEENEESNIYLGSFLPSGLGDFENHDDELIMWRTYGKDEVGNEAAGCSMVLDINFFDKTTGYVSLGHENIYDSRTRQFQLKEKNNSQALFHVIYYDQRNGKLAANKIGTNQKIIKQLVDFKKGLKALLRLKKNKNSLKSRAIDKIIFLSISELRYLFKSSDYAFENELRVIISFPSKNRQVMIDENNTPNRLYINSSKPVLSYINKIVLGPKVPFPERWIYLEAIMNKSGYKVELKKSMRKFQ
jgi:tetratricopeptide (TPR) repeat protein